MSNNKNKDDHFLTRGSTIKILWFGALASLFILVLLDFFVKHYEHFGIEATFGFAAWFGFLACIILVVGSKIIGAFFKREETYYDQ